MRVGRRQNGDTIIEVLFAFTIFSLIAVGGLSLMSQGSALAQRALEIGLVRQQMDAQADALRYLNRAYVADYGKNGVATKMWEKVVKDHSIDQAQAFDSIADSKGCRIPSATENAFALDLNNIDPKKLEQNPSLNPIIVPTSDISTYARVRYEPELKAEGIWIQAVQSPSTIGISGGRELPGFYDFHVRACWFTPGQASPVTLGTIVRLYEPRG